MASGSAAAGESDFSVLVLGSDFATDAGAALLTHADREDWHDCLPDLSEAEADACFSDLEELQVVRVQGTDRAGRTIVRVVGKFFPDQVEVTTDKGWTIPIVKQLMKLCNELELALVIRRPIHNNKPPNKAIYNVFNHSRNIIFFILPVDNLKLPIIKPHQDTPSSTIGRERMPIKVAVDSF
ncbi:hypothetical protein PVAP13_5NG366601 [Panicum virgatum]|uniref:Uncharacterized protein n=1 Tax=Panicum virgatum TaxID=38727 RepID=A0A8T0SCQ9_PANVG|nr:hypothetical protein PVAP13_5NG366601 [Panicum virgatum]